MAKTEALFTRGAESLLRVLNDGGGILGYLTKFPDTETEIHPWKAHSLDYSVEVGEVRGLPKVGKLIGFFETKAAAMAAVKKEAF